MFQPAKPTPEEKEAQRQNTTKHFTTFFIYVSIIRIDNLDFWKE
ncbi:9004_t:CDS:2 [Diversispora eburnea]|uniref:9004_t:CDS:1 n=1 Tax=Diversispora eburnea TaxID=1213867 RepID=A0A9N8VQZ4_9GLOM|nr:9004_t:CDS:2 [Diversispora eburnea]